MGGGADSTFAPPPFRGMDTEDADGWTARFEKYSTYRGFADRERLNLIAVLLRDEASDWYDSLEDDIKTGWPNLKQAFEQRFQNSELSYGTRYDSFDSPSHNNDVDGNHGSNASIGGRWGG